MGVCLPLVPAAHGAGALDVYRVHVWVGCLLSLVLRVPHLPVWVGAGFVRDWCLGGGGGCLPQPASGRIVPEFLIKPVDRNTTVCLLNKEVKRVMLQNQQFLVRLRVEYCADPEKMDRSEFKAFAEVLRRCTPVVPSPLARPLPRVHCGLLSPHGTRFRSCGHRVGCVCCAPPLLNACVHVTGVFHRTQSVHRGGSHGAV
jgi:hypothetical protein